jgi:hypothetical protein
MTTGIKRRHEPPRIVGDLLSAEIAEKQARSIKYQLTIAKLPLAKDLEGFDFTGTPINEALVRDLASGGFLAEQRNAVLIGAYRFGAACDPSRARQSQPPNTEPSAPSRSAYAGQQTRVVMGHVRQGGVNRGGV